MKERVSVTVTGERAEEFREIFGTTTVPVVSPFSEIAELGDTGEHECFMLDLERISHEQYDRLVAHIARKFGTDEAAVAASLRERGLPIKAEDCLMSISLRMFIG